MGDRLHQRVAVGDALGEAWPLEKRRRAERLQCNGSPGTTCVRVTQEHNHLRATARTRCQIERDVGQLCGAPASRAAVELERTVGAGAHQARRQLVGG
eukprot:3272960-Prymnesium_polylepis.2